MSTSNVRNIESLDSFHEALVRLAGDWDKATQEIRMMVHRADEYFGADRPAYWRSQSLLAQRELTEAKDGLAQKRSAGRPGDRPPATEAAQRVRVAGRRLQECEEKQREAKRWALEMSKQCESVLGPLADVSEHCESLLPRAATELRTIIDQLRLYTEQPKEGAG